MQVCTWSSLVAFTLLFAVSGFAGCGSSNAPAENAEASSTPAAPELPAGSEPAGSEPAGTEADSASKSGGDKWEGETEATSAPAATGEPETRTTELIQKIITEHRKPVRDCYDKARKDVPDLKGTMTIKFVLDPEGKMKSAELNVERSEVKSPLVVDCAIAALKTIKFPASSRGMDTMVNYPFNFKP